MSENEGLSEGALKNISFMNRMSRTIPDDFFNVAAVQELAEIVSQISPLISREQEASLLGIGALMIRDGRAEAIAGIQAAIALRNAGRGLPA